MNKNGSTTLWEPFLLLINDSNRASVLPVRLQVSPAAHGRASS